MGINTSSQTTASDYFEKDRGSAGVTGNAASGSNSVDKKFRAKKAINELDKKIEDDIKKLYKKTEDDIKKIDQKIEDDAKKIDEKIDQKIDGRVEKRFVRIQQQVIGSLAIFVALFTFISLNFQLATLTTNILQAAGVVALSLSGLGVFLLCLAYFLDMLKAEKALILAKVIIGGFFISVLLLVFGNPMDQNARDEEVITEKINTKIKDELIQLRSQLNDATKNNQQLEQKQQTLLNCLRNSTANCSL